MSETKTTQMICAETCQVHHADLSEFELVLFILRNGQRSALLFGPLTKGPADQQVRFHPLHA